MYDRKLDTRFYLLDFYEPYKVTIVTKSASWCCGFVSASAFTNICITTFNSQIYDPNNKRYEVPIVTPTVSTQATELDYDVNVNTFPFGISVKRKSTNTVM